MNWKKIIYFNINRINKNKQAMTVKQIIQKIKTLHLKNFKILLLLFEIYTTLYTDEDRFYRHNE